MQGKFAHKASQPWASQPAKKMVNHTTAKHVFRFNNVGFSEY